MKLESDEWVFLGALAPLALYGAFNKKPPMILNAIAAVATVYQMTQLVRKAIAKDETEQALVTSQPGNRFYLPGKTLADLLS